MGLVNELVPDGRAFERAHSFALDYALEVNRNTVALAKQAIVHAYGAPRGTARLIDELSDLAQATGDTSSGDGDPS